MAKMAFKALTGQRGDLPRDGTLMILTVFLLWRVLLHLMRMWAPGGAKKMSALANCSRGLKEDREWGTRLEILRNEKKDVRKHALYIWPIYIESQVDTMLVRIGMSIIVLRETRKGALSFRAFVK